MKTIKIYLQRPWKFSDSPYYLYLRENPPKGIEYVNALDFSLIQSKNKLKFMNWLKQYIKNFIKLIYPSMPNAHFTKNAEKYDVIHCAHCLSKNNRNWVCDIEWVGQFWALGDIGKKKKKIIKYLKSPYCKKIIAWTNWSKQGIIKEFPEIKNKVEVVYPAIPEQKFKKIKTGKIVLLYASRRFYFKGGLYAVEVMDRITKENKNVEGWIVSDVPKGVFDKYKNNNQIKFLGMKPQKELFEKIYPATDIFLYPSFTDSLGFGILEAMSFGIPVVSCDGQSRKELIQNSKTGFVISKEKKIEISQQFLKNLSDYKLIDELEKTTTLLIRSNKLRRIISKNCIKEIQNGKFVERLGILN